MLLLQPASRNLRRLRRRDVILPVTSVRAANGLAEISKSAVNIAIIRVCDYVRDSVRVCVCLSVCPHDKTKTAETKIAKLGTGIVHHDTSPTTVNIRSKVKGQGHRVIKCKRRSSVSGMSYALYRVPMLL